MKRFYILICLIIAFPAQAKDVGTFNECKSALENDKLFIETKRPDLDPQFLEEIIIQFIKNNDLSSLKSISTGHRQLPEKDRYNSCAMYNSDLGPYLIARKVIYREVSNLLEKTRMCIAAAVLNTEDTTKLGSEVKNYSSVFSEEIDSALKVQNKLYKNSEFYTYQKVLEEAYVLIQATRKRGSLAIGALNKKGLQDCDEVGAIGLLAALDKANGTHLVLETILKSKPLATPPGEGLGRW